MSMASSENWTTNRDCRSPSLHIIVVGGGAAGMMAAVQAAGAGASVTLLEPGDRLGRKLNITGKGRCNLTNDATVEETLSHILRNSRFLYSALSRFPPRSVMAFFEELGVPLKVERGRRVFPASDRAFDVSAALERRLRALGVRITRDRALSILTERVGGLPAAAGVAGEGGTYPGEAVIVATGGVSYPATGSTGEGHRMAASLGHTITPLRGSLVPLRERGGRCARAQGLSLRNVRLTLLRGERPLFSDFGELLFTHFGVSGPLALSASAHLPWPESGECRLEVDLKPALDEETLDRRLVSDLRKYGGREFQNALDDLLPRKLIPLVVEESGVPPRTRAGEVSRQERRGLLRALKAFPIPLAGTRPVTEAVVTAGGVAVTEVNPSTMESRLVEGLFFAGEILDLDAYTGGFNLQIAWSTGRAAGLAAAKGPNHDKERAP